MKRQYRIYPNMTDKVAKWVHVSAGQLKVGDTIKVWWQPNRDTITGLYPYVGPLECMKGGMTATFAILATGMTIEPGSEYEVLRFE